MYSASFNLIQDGKGKKDPPIQCFPCNFEGYTLFQSKIIECELRAPLKKWFFWSNPYKIEVMITSFIEMLELPDVGHITTSTMQFSRTIKFCWWRNGHKLWRRNLYSKFLYFKKIYSSNFADIIIKTTFKDSKKVKRIRSYVWMLSIKVILMLTLWSYVSISVFLDITKVADFQWKNANVSWT